MISRTSTHTWAMCCPCLCRIWATWATSCPRSSCTSFAGHHRSRRWRRDRERLRGWVEEGMDIQNWPSGKLSLPTHYPLLHLCLPLLLHHLHLALSLLLLTPLSPFCSLSREFRSLLNRPAICGTFQEAESFLEHFEAFI